MAGSTQRLGDENKQMRSVVKAVKHPQTDDIRNDIAILYLNESLIFNKFVQPIPLAQPKTALEVKNPVQVSGWGHSTDPFELPHKLKYGIIFMYDKDRCNSTYLGRVRDGMICAKSKGPFQAPWAGDLGGPMTNNGTLFGIISWPIRTNYKEPNVFTEIAFYYEWIKQTIQQNNLFCQS